MWNARRVLMFVFGALWVGLMLVVFVWPARAQDQGDSRWIYRTIRQQYWAYDHWTGQTVLRYRYVQRRYPNHSYRLPETRVYSYIQREDDRGDRRVDRGRCARDEETHKPIWLEVLSTEHQGEEAAREAARKAWMARAQWDVGGAYMNLDEAQDVRWRCGPSNAHDTASGRVSEVVGTVTGKGGQNVRCSVIARPCKGPRESDRGRR